MDLKTVRCTICGNEFTDKEIEFVGSCPSCSTKSLPCAISDDVNIKINWHELHILVVWAENWARKIDNDHSANGIADLFNHLYTVMVIAQRLQRQCPNKNALTLFGEIKDIRNYLEKNHPTSELITDLDDESKLGF